MKIIAHTEQPTEEWRRGAATRMQVSALNGSHQLCIFEQWIEPAMGAPTHRHPVEEILSIISGEAEIWIDGQDAIVTAGHSVVIPPNAKHGFRNVGTDTLHLQAVLAAPFFEASFDDREPIRRWLNETDS